MTDTEKFEGFKHDPRFTSYYDEKQPGTATFLRDAILIYTGMQN